MLQSGLCERLITAAHRCELAAIPDERQPAVLHDKAETAEVLCLYVADVTRVALERMQESKLDVQAQIALVNRIQPYGEQLFPEGDLDDFGCYIIDSKDLPPVSS